MNLIRRKREQLEGKRVDLERALAELQKVCTHDRRTIKRGRFKQRGMIFKVVEVCRDCNLKTGYMNGKLIES